MTAPLIFSRVRLRRKGAAGTLARLLDRAVAVEGDHRLVWALFGEEDDRPRDFLYRRFAPGAFYILSRSRPTNAGDLWRIESKTFAPVLSTGQRLRFMLRANPSLRGGRGAGSGAGKRHDAVMHHKRSLDPGSAPVAHPRKLEQDAGTAWLAGRAPRCGFSFDAGEIAVSGYTQHRLPRPGGSSEVRFSTLDFEGVLTVTDTEAFSAMLCRGLGPAKAFGCGLMLIRPAKAV